MDPHADLYRAWHSEPEPSRPKLFQNTSTRELHGIWTQKDRLPHIRTAKRHPHVIVAPTQMFLGLLCVEIALASTEAQFYMPPRLLD